MFPENCFVRYAEEKSEMKRLYIFFTILIVLIVLCALILFSGNAAHMERLGIDNNAEVSAAPIQHQTKTLLFADGDGAVCEWSNHILRQHGGIREKITLPAAFFPVDHGVGYLSDGSLWHWSSDGTEKIAEGVALACWDGKDFLWLDADHSAVFGSYDGKTQQIFDIGPEKLGEPLIMAASDRWIILGSYRNGNFFTDTLVYDRKEKMSTSVPLSLDGNDYAYLWEDKLIKIGGSQDTFCCLDLSNLEITQFESGITADQGVITASAAYDQTRRVLYVSVFSEPELPEFYESNSATFAINLSDQSIERVDDNFYSALGIKDGAVFGVKKGLFGTWKSVELSNKKG